jgi:hypothetical protein
MSDTKDYSRLDGPATMCQKYHVVRGSVVPRKDTLECEYEKFDRWHKYSCKYYDHVSGMCRKLKNV